MSGILTIFSEKFDSNGLDIDYLLDPIESTNNDNKLLKTENGFLYGSFPEGAINNKIYKNDKWNIILAGDLIDYNIVPFDIIINNLEKKQYNFFQSLNGIFSIIAYNKKESNLFVITDRLGIYPLFYLINSKAIYISSKLSTFCRLKIGLNFNEKWLYEFIYFNYPLGDTTFLKNVNRLGAASILEINVNNNEYLVKTYKNEELIKSQYNLNDALDLFSNRIPKYFDKNCKNYFSLTGGWDARTIFSFYEKNTASTFTYGIEGCSDRVYANNTARCLDINHNEINLDEKFLDNLPKYILETVFLSAGQQGILRSHLLYVYENIAKSSCTIFLSGIYFDNIYRGHMNSPYQISTEIADLMRTGSYDLGNIHKMLKIKEKNFDSDISKKVNDLKKYGKFKSNEFHLNYQLYETLKNYFGGEISIANEFGTIRIPSLDSELLKFAYHSKYSALEYSEYGGHKRGDSENILQAFLISKTNPMLAKVPINGVIIPNTILKGKYYFLINSKLRKLVNRIKLLYNPNPKPPLENWELWLNKMHKDFIDNLIFNDNSRVKKYFKAEFISKIENTREIEYIGKLTTIEIIIRLIETNWERFW